MQSRERFEILVVGAGPCGIAVGAAAKKAGVSCALFDKGCITSSLMDYPYYMTFSSTARMLEIGDVPFTIANALDPEWVSVNAGAEMELGGNMRAAVSITSDMGRGPLSNEQAQASLSWRL